jgi:hypothetical protein
LLARAEASRPAPVPLTDDALTDAVRNDLTQHGLTGHEDSRRTVDDNPRDHDPRDIDYPVSPASAGRTPVADDQAAVVAARQRRSTRLDRNQRRDRADTRSRRRIRGPGPGSTADQRGLKGLMAAKGPSGPGRRLSDATVARLGATLLWVLVIVAAYGGINAWLRPSSSASADQAVAAPGDVIDGRWAAAGFAERYVAAYLSAGSEGAALTPYLGYAPELPTTAEPAATSEPLRVVEVVRGHDQHVDYWSVTVAAGERDPATLESPESDEGADTSSEGTEGGEGEGGEAEDDQSGGSAAGESFWQVAVDTSGDQPVAVGLPALVSGPPAPEQIDLALSLRRPPRDEPMVESVEGFLAAYLCGGSDLDRYVHPDYVDPAYEVPTGGAAGTDESDAQDSGSPLSPADPPVCEEVVVERWADAPARQVASTATSDAAATRRTVIAEVTFDAGSDARRAMQALTLAERDGRWEVAALLPAPPIEER